MYNSLVYGEKHWVNVKRPSTFLGVLACSSARTFYDLGTNQSQ